MRSRVPGKGVGKGPRTEEQGVWTKCHGSSRIVKSAVQAPRTESLPRKARFSPGVLLMGLDLGGTEHGETVLKTQQPHVAC